MPRDDFFESAIEIAKRLGRLTYVDESVTYLPVRQDLSIVDVELPDHPQPREKH